MKNRAIICLITISLFIFLSVAFWLTPSNGYLYDYQVIAWIEGISTKVLKQIMLIISLIGSSEIILLATVVISVIFLIKRYWQLLHFFMIISIGGVALNFLLKILFQKERPGGIVSSIEVFSFSFDIPSYSFPSGHMMRVTLLFLFLIYLSYSFIDNIFLKWTVYLSSFLLMIGVALSRIFLDAHFMSDIIGAISISTTWFCLILLILKKNHVSHYN
ncbi:phosphatase PAP2 family protein [Amphibacillus indicireducens]|uniref:Phosphatidic acid phosphatase type 2/haloperoxidase domain-containing protein n=1 Tax=Amphibacillus indicireducens TaxID=1076330 RepID=A0ABP7VVY2_9BACI